MLSLLVDVLCQAILCAFVIGSTVSMFKGGAGPVEVIVKLYRGEIASTWSKSGVNQRAQRKGEPR